MNEEYLYRYMSFYSFVDMIQKKALTFVKPNLWDDTYENYFFKIIRKQEYLKKYIDFLKNSNCSNISQYLLNILFMEGYPYLQSWSKLEESDAMWRIYNYNNYAIKIKVALTNIKLFENISIVSVKYTDKFSFEEFLKVIFPYGTHNICVPVNSLVYKRKAFQHEQEVRLIKYIVNPDSTIKYLKEEYSNIEEIFNEIKSSIDYNDDFFQIVNALWGVLDNLKNHLPNTFDLPISINIENFIDSVTLHPFAPEWFSSTLNNFCKENGNIKYIGKSKLYEIL